MRSKPLIILGSFVVAAVLLIVACEGAGKESPLQIQAPDVTLDEQRIPADGVSSVEVTVTVLTADNKKVENVPINLIARSAADTSEDLGTLSQSVVFTDATGEATATLTSIESSRDTSAIIFASMGDTTGINLTINPKTGATFSAVPAPPGAVAILSFRGDRHHPDIEQDTIAGRWRIDSHDGSPCPHNTRHQRAEYAVDIRRPGRKDHTHRPDRPVRFRNRDPDGGDYRFHRRRHRGADGVHPHRHAPDTICAAGTDDHC